jgi:hypothetical protein
MPPGRPPFPFDGAHPPPPPGDRRFGPGAPGMGPPPAHRTDALTFLRGVQLSDANGEARFTTIYPGWYQGRAVHMHLRVRTGGGVTRQTYAGGHVAHTGQLYLPESESDRVFLLPPYAAHNGVRLRQARDPIFADGGAGGLVQLARTTLESGAIEYVATATIALDPSVFRAPKR